jgi:serine protease Do
MPGGFAVPLDANFRRIIDVLKRGEEIEYGFLGVHLADPAFGSKPRPGVLIDEIALGSPAEKAGFQQRDRILTIGGRPVRDLDDLYLLIAIQLAGNTVEIEVERSGRRLVLKPELAKAYVPGPIIASRRPAARMGLRVDHASVYTQRARVLNVYEGVMIREVAPGSPADRAKLQPDKLIARVNGRPVRSPAEFYLEMEKAERTGAGVTLTLRTAEGKEDPVPVEIK